MLQINDNTAKPRYFPATWSTGVKEKPQSRKYAMPKPDGQIKKTQRIIEA
jgi:hypothetical protein